MDFTYGREYARSVRVDYSYFDGLLYVRKRQSNPALKHLVAMQPDLSQGRVDGARGRCQVDA